MTCGLKYCISNDVEPSFGKPGPLKVMLAPERSSPPKVSNPGEASLLDEIRRLKAENSVLKAENEALKAGSPDEASELRRFEIRYIYEDRSSSGNTGFVLVWAHSTELAEKFFLNQYSVMKNMMKCSSMPLKLRVASVEEKPPQSELYAGLKTRRLSRQFRGKYFEIRGNAV